ALGPQISSTLAAMSISRSLVRLLGKGRKANRSPPIGRQTPTRRHTTNRWKMSKVCVITGASSGLGRTLAEEVLAQGYRVIATARNTSGLRNLFEKYPDEARAVTLDVT